jgi:hypothetical protein
LHLSSYRIDALLIGPVEVGWLPVTRELYRSCHVYIPAITIRMTDENFVRYHGGDDTPSVLLNLIRLQCVVAVVKPLKVLATYREIW